MDGEVELVVRRARANDAARRADLVRLCFAAPLWDTFFFFFFQELTLECCVLGGAVLFIFCGVSAVGVIAILPTAAVLVLLIVLVAGYALAAEQAQKINKEMFGLVAEARGPLRANVPARVRVRLATSADAEDLKSQYSQVVGTVSVSARRGAYAAGWLHALAVHPEWRRRGAGRALEAAARREARAAGLRALDAATSQLQPAARALLHQAGWECRGAYARPLCGAALALPVARLGVALDAPLDLA